MPPLGLFILVLQQLHSLFLFLQSFGTGGEFQRNRDHGRDKAGGRVSGTVTIAYHQEFSSSQLCPMSTDPALYPASLVSGSEMTLRLRAFQELPTLSGVVYLKPLLGYGLGTEKKPGPDRRIPRNAGACGTCQSLVSDPLELADSTVCPLPASSGYAVRTSSTTQNFARIQ